MVMAVVLLQLRSNDLFKILPSSANRFQKIPSSPSAIRTHNSSSSSSSMFSLRAITDEGSTSTILAEEQYNVSRMVQVVDSPVTGGAFDFKSATPSLLPGSLTTSKKVTIVRHGLSSWNAENKIQGSTNLSILTDTGVRQAEMCRKALSNITFDCCFSSPISRAKSSAELIWKERESAITYLDSLKELHLFFLEGMTNDDAKIKYPELYTAWREDPVNFHLDELYPVVELWRTARQAWNEILLTPGGRFLVVTHKSILRALICTALGLGPERFRAIDVNNGGISTLVFNKHGEAMLQALNLTSHIYNDNVYYE